MKLDRRIYRTGDGRLVEQNDPDAAYLEYPAGTELSDHAARNLGLASDAGEGQKKRSKPRDKSRSAPEDKSEE